MTGTDSMRAAHVAGLRKIADALEADPTLPLPHHGAASELLWFMHSPEAVRAARALMAPGATMRMNSTRSYPLEVSGVIDGVRVRVYGDPEEVCEKISSRTVEVYEWAFDGEPVEPVGVAS